MTFCKDYVVIFLMLTMYKNLNLKTMRDSFALLVIAAIIVTVVSFVAQLFIISFKYIYDLIFNNQNF